MSTWLLSALVLGLGGSLHCAGMCGPLLLCLPPLDQRKETLLHLVYHSGRIMIYALLGFVFALAGSQLQWAGWQQYLSIGVGLLLLVFLVLSNQSRFNPLQTLWNRYTASIRGGFGKLLRADGVFSRLGMGALNGLLPCGLVYAALAGALVTGSAWEGAFYMGLFGLGTLPLLLGIQMGRGMLFSHFRSWLNRSKTVLTFAMAVLLILRGLNLGIPYLSPQLQQGTCHTAVNCCTQK